MAQGASVFYGDVVEDFQPAGDGVRKRTELRGVWATAGARYGLPVSAFGKIRHGQRALVMPEAPVGGRYPARVEIVDQVFDAASGTFGVRLTLPNPERRIPAGLKCRALF